MNREEFLTQLKSLLTGISEEEREEALQYYEDYFDDAGPEQEEQVIQELGRPEKIAAMILADLKGNDTESGEFTEHGYTDERFVEKESLACREEEKKTKHRYFRQEKEAENRYSYYENGTDSSRYGYGESAYQNQGAGNGEKPPRTSRWLKVLLIALIIIVAVPTVVPLFFAAAAVVIAVVCAVFGIFAGLVVGALAIAAAGFFIIIAGLLRVFAIPAAALLTIGIGMLILVLGIILTAVTVKLCMVIYPAMFRGVVNLFRKPFHRKAVS